MRQQLQAKVEVQDSLEVRLADLNIALQKEVAAGTLSRARMPVFFSYGSWPNVLKVGEGVTRSNSV